MRGQDILDLPGLQDGGEMTDLEVAAALGLKLQDTRGRLSTLVIQERLTRIPGIAKFPARYRLKTRITPWGATQTTQRQSRG